MTAIASLVTKAAGRPHTRNSGRVVALIGCGAYAKIVEHTLLPESVPAVLAPRLTISVMYLGVPLDTTEICLWDTVEGTGVSLCPGVPLEGRQGNECQLYEAVGAVSEDSPWGLSSRSSSWLERAGLELSEYLRFWRSVL